MQFPFKNLSERNKLYLLSLLVGLGSGFAAVLLDFVIRLIRDLLTSGFSAVSSNWLYFVYPGAGMLISYLLVRYVVKDNIGHGVTKVLLAVSRNESRIKPHNTWSSMLTSSITIGFGGSVGAEAPIVYTGAAIGSNIGRAFNLSYRSVTTLLGCGAAGAVAGIFKAPLAGVLFTLEILLFNVSLSSMFPLLLSTVTATVVSYIFRGQAPVFQATLTQFSMANLPFYLVLGVGCGLVSKLLRFDNSDSLKIGVGMMTRGEVALIVAQRGLKAGIIDSRFFTAVILLIVVSSILTPVLLKLIYTRDEKKILIKNPGLS